MKGENKMKRNLQIGDKEALTKAFTAEEVALFSRISGDDNPIHLDEEYASKTIFGQRIVHGMLVASLFSAILGSKLPGMGTIYLGQNLQFKNAVKIGEPITAIVELINIREDKPILTFKTICLNSKGDVVIDGEAVVKV